MALLEVLDLSVHRGGARVLDGVSLSAGRGEIVGLIGPNGAGKSTLFDAVGGYVPATSGSITLGGADLGALSADRRARLGVGRTFQTPQLAGSLTAGEALLAGCQARMRTGLCADALRLPRSRRAELLARREAERVAALVGLTDHLRRRCDQLPLGVLRLVELGRALCGAPRAVLLDEIASGIARTEVAGLRRLLARLRSGGGPALVLVEHDVDFVLGLCDFVYVLDAGRVIARGRPSVVRSHPAVVAAYLGEDAA